MSVEWLKERVQQFHGIPDHDVQTISDFFWLWTFFEAKCLGADANFGAIRRLVGRWAEAGKLKPERFSESLAFYRHRYFKNDEFTHHYDHLHLDWHGEEIQSLVRQVLSKKENGDRQTTEALLMIIYRLRNNLFHGPKWRYYIEGQGDNFLQANRVLKAAIEMDGRGLE